ncbi:DUF2946 family protein [Zavarzinia sp. CC-PAN008]|uniref:DUF2946 family protein n=1 Tax=Zavarzinia sp. CC-PAN008 TaxID=3243332 RepID=UPI003F7423CF
MTGGFGKAAKQGAAHLALLLLLVRAMIPAGFMPDMAALRDGRIQVVLCSTDGQRVVVLDRDGKAVDDGSGRHDAVGALHCPFGLVAAQAFILPILPQLGPSRAFERDCAPACPAQAAPPPARGPPLGARAPPALSV